MRECPGVRPAAGGGNGSRVQAHLPLRTCRRRCARRQSSSSFRGGKALKCRLVAEAGERPLDYISC